MEPVTHLLTGACLARSGLNRRAAYTTLAMVIAAELSDIDTVWVFRGPVDAFQHHRGITHTFLGVPFEAAFVLALVYALHRWRAARHRESPATVQATSAPHDITVTRVVRPLTAAPVRWGLLYGFTVLALLSHLLLDYTNNYGLRPFFPFSPHWYAASIVFIFDPYIFVLLLLGLIAPPIFRLVSAEVGARKRPFAAPGWSAAALLLVLGLWGVRWVEHDRAVQLATAQSLEAPQSETPNSGTPATDESSGPQQVPPPTYLSARRVLASPDPLSLFRWYTVTDFGPLYQLERADTLRGTIVATEGTYAKADQTPAVRAAAGSQLGRVFLDWSPMPIISTDTSTGALSQAVAGTDLMPPIGGSLVTFRDPRFMGVLPWVGESTGRKIPLSGAVLLDDREHVLLQLMDGRAEAIR